MKLITILVFSLLATFISAEELPKRITLKDVAFLSVKQREDLPEIKVFGEVEILAVKPDEETEDKFTVVTIDTSGDKMPSGARAHWVTGQVRGEAKGEWVQVRCILQAPEETALRLRKGRKMNIVGMINKVETEPATKNTIEIIRLHLREVKSD